MRDLMSFTIYTVAVIAGIVAGFFIVFNSIFSDVSDSGERVFSFALVIGVYGILGLLFGFLARSWKAGLALAAPAVLLVVWYSSREPENFPLHVAYIVVTVGTAWVGAYWGARLRNRATPVSRG